MNFPFYFIVMKNCQVLKPFFLKYTIEKEAILPSLLDVDNSVMISGQGVLGFQLSEAGSDEGVPRWKSGRHVYFRTLCS